MARKKTLKSYNAEVGKRADGTPIIKPFFDLTKAAAKAKAVKYLTEIQYDAHPVSENEFYFRGWAQRYLLTYKKPFVTPNAYYTTYENPIYKHLLPVFGDRLLADITPEEVQDFYNSKSYLSHSMCSKISMNLRAIFETAIDNDKCFKNPTRRCSIISKAIPHVKEVWDDKQITLAHSFFIKRMPEVVLMLETGVRREEMAGWYKTDFDLRHKAYAVDRAIIRERGNQLKEVPPKKDSNRVNPLSPIAEQAYKILLDKYPGSVYLVPDSDGGPLNTDNWSLRLKTAMKEFCAAFHEATALTAHELRHTYGTKLRRWGVDIYTIAKVLGHRSVEVTARIYVHNEISALRKAMRPVLKKTELIAA